MSARTPIDEQHLLSLRSRVASSVAQRMIKSAEFISSGVLVNVEFVLSRSGRGSDDSEQCVALLLQIARSIKSLLENSENEKARKWCFAIARGPPHRENDAWPVILSASDEETLKKAVARLNTRFLARVKISESELDLDEGNATWLGHITEVGTPEHDKSLLWEVVLRASLSLTLDPSLPPPGAKSIAQTVAIAQTRLERLSPTEAFHEHQERLSSPSPVVLIDIRTSVQRSIHGVIPSAIHINRIFLEFALDPQSPEHPPFVEEHKYNLRPIVFDQDGVASSIAAAALHDLGLLQATDIVGGFDAWKKTGLPITNDYS